MSAGSGHGPGQCTAAAPQRQPQRRIPVTACARRRFGS
jgi:hypothetical protein